jgi:hypothetical protein
MLKSEGKLRTESIQFHLLFSILVFIPTFFCFSANTYAIEDYTLSSSAVISAGGADRFILTTPANLGGQIYMEVWDQENCQVKFKVWAKANTQEKARQFTDMVDLSLERNEDLVTLKLTTPHPAPWEGSNFGIEASLYIFLPRNFEVETRTHGFDLDFSGPFSKVDIQNQYGNIQVNDVSEETNITGSYDQVEVKNIQGELNIETSYNSILAQDIDTKDSQANLKTSYGKINVERFEGQLEANTVYGNIYASDITLRGGRNEIKTVYSKIELDLTKIEDATLFVNNTYGNIDVVASPDLSARLLLTVGRGGKIRTSGIIIQPTELNRTTLEGTCGDGDSEIEITIEGIGQIVLEGR